MSTPTRSTQTPSLFHHVHPNGPTAPILQRKVFPDRPDVWALDLAGSAVPCPFAPLPPRADLAVSPVRLAERLTEELTALADAPRTVLFGPSGDPLGDPVAHDEVARAIDALAARGIVSWLPTRSVVGGPVLDALTRHRPLVRVSVGFCTLDPVLHPILEPGAAPPAARLRQFAELLRRNVPVEATLEPIFPGLTDTREQFQALLSALAEAGADRVTTGYLVLWPGTREPLFEALEPGGWSELVLGAFANGPLVRCGTQFARLLPKPRRQRGYATLMALADELGIKVRVSGRSNPDFRPPAPPDPASAARVRSLMRRLRDQDEDGPSVSAVGA